MDTKTFIQQEWVKDELKSRLDYDPDTGKLTWATREGNTYFNENFAGKEVGQKWVDKNGYHHATVRITFGRREVTFVTARLCWFVMTSDWPEHTIDHINRDSWDNRWSNLRDVTQSENNQNKGFYKTRNFAGISRHERGFSLRLKGRHLGRSNCFGKLVKMRNKLLTEKQNHCS